MGSFKSILSSNSAVTMVLDIGPSTAYGHPLRSYITLKKNRTDSPFTSSCKLSIAPHLGWEFLTTSLLHALILSGLIVYRPCTPYHNHCEFTLALSCCTEEHFHCAHQLPLTDRGLLIPFSRWPLSIWRKSIR